MGTRTNAYSDSGHIFRQHRKQKGLSQSDLAEEMNERGLTSWTQNTVSRLENNERVTLTIEEVAALKEILGEIAPTRLQLEIHSDPYVKTDESEGYNSESRLFVNAGSLFQDRRKGIGLSQAALAQKMQEKGFTNWYQNTVSRLEKNRRSNLTFKEKEALESILGSIVPTALTKISPVLEYDPEMKATKGRNELKQDFVDMNIQNLENSLSQLQAQLNAANVALGQLKKLLED